MLVLPELCLTGYDDPEGTPYAEKRQVQLAEAVPGPSSNAVAQAAHELGLWVVFGMPEHESVALEQEAATSSKCDAADCHHATPLGSTVDGERQDAIRPSAARSERPDANRRSATAATAKGNRTTSDASQDGGTPASAISARTPIYNAACVISPEGIVGTYRKIHPFGRENEWAIAGTDPCVFDTPWGPVGLGICYDLYSFPEMVMYAKAKGARLFLNPTAAGWAVSAAEVFREKIEVTCLRGNLYVATANLQGTDLTSTFVGQSHIIGPLGPRNSIRYFAGTPFAEQPEPQPGLRIATIDLSAVENQASWNLHVFGTNPITGRPDWRPDLYAKWFAEIAADPQWQVRSRTH